MSTPLRYPHTAPVERVGNGLQPNPSLPRAEDPAALFRANRGQQAVKDGLLALQSGLPLGSSGSTRLPLVGGNIKIPAVEEGGRKGSRNLG